MEKNERWRVVGERERPRGPVAEELAALRAMAEAEEPIAVSSTESGESGPVQSEEDTSELSEILESTMIGLRDVSELRSELQALRSALAQRRETIVQADRLTVSEESTSYLVDMLWAKLAPIAGTMTDAVEVASQTASDLGRSAAEARSALRQLLEEGAKPLRLTGAQPNDPMPPRQVKGVAAWWLLPAVLIGLLIGLLIGRETRDWAREPETLLAMPEITEPPHPPSLNAGTAAKSKRSGPARPATSGH